MGDEEAYSRNNSSLRYTLQNALSVIIVHTYQGLHLTTWLFAENAIKATQQIVKRVYV